MLSTLALTLLALAPLPGAVQDEARPPGVEAVVDPRVELLSLVFRLAGRPEYNQPQSGSPYARSVDEAFGPFRDHPVVALAQELTRRRGVSYDAVMSYALHLTDVETLGERVPFDRPPEALDRRWTPADARAFARDLRDFVEVTGFREHAAEQQAFWEAAAGRLGQAVARSPVPAWLERFFGPREGARLLAIVGLLNGSGNYGMRVVLADGGEELSPVIGAERWDAEGLPVFGGGFEELLAHEFCHSYTNPLVERHLDRLRPLGQRLLEAERTRMEQQAYGSPSAVLNETLVRACVARFVAETADAEALERYLARQQERGFAWTRALDEELARAAGDGSARIDLEGLVPRLAERLEAWCDAHDQARARAPRLVASTPAAGASDVDPELAALRFEFDRPMRDRSWSLVGGGPDFPDVGAPSYDEARRVLTVPVTLAPGRTYRLWLNGPRHQGFASADGAPLEPVELSFTTRGS